MVEDTYTRRGCVVILMYGGVMQWSKIAIVQEKDGALEHYRKLGQTYTRSVCVCVCCDS